MSRQTGIFLALCFLTNTPNILKRQLPFISLYSTMELSLKQMKTAETRLRSLLPKGLRVFGSLLLQRTNIKANPSKYFVDKWPDFDVVVCKPHLEQGDDSYCETIVYAEDEAGLEAIIRNPNVFDWTKCNNIDMCLSNREVFKAVAAEKQIPIRDVAVCQIMTLTDLSRLPTCHSSSIRLGSLNESHVGLVNEMWKYGQREKTVRMIGNMVRHFPSSCVLDAEGRPVSWVLTNSSCAMCLLYTLPEHRGKGYARIVTNTLAKKLLGQGFPAYCQVEETNASSYALVRSQGFNKVSFWKEASVEFNYHI